MPEELKNEAPPEAAAKAAEAPAANKFIPEKELSPALNLIPILITLAVVAGFWVFSGWEHAVELVLLGLAKIFTMGIFVVFLGLVEQFQFLGMNIKIAADGFTPLFLAVLVVYIDMLFAVVAIINMRFIYKIPILGRMLANVAKNSEAMLDANPWARKITFLALMAFVWFPLAGTGAIGGVIFGTLLGLRRKLIFLGILLGSAFGGFSMYVLAVLCGNVFKMLGQHPVAQWALIIGGIVVIGAILLILSRRVKRGFGKKQC
jgi:uncharacterized membrane protein